MKLLFALLLGALLLAHNPAWGQETGGLLQQGQAVYENNCADCHRTNGEGLAVKFPALKGNAFVMGDPKPVLETVLQGRTGKMGQMPAWKEFLTNDQVAAVVSYIRNAWGNQAAPVTPEMAAKVRGR